MASEPYGNILTDSQSLDALVAKMPQVEREEYDEFKSLTLESAFPGRKLAVYTLSDGNPVRIEGLLIGEFGYSRENGPIISLEGGGRQQDVSVVPRKWASRDVFFQVPQHFTLKWAGKQSARVGTQFGPHYAILIKTRSKEAFQIDGHTYCTTLNKFRERFPKYAITY